MKKAYIVELKEKEAGELMNEHWVGELVQCKDCKKRFTKDCILFFYHTQRLENWHCADGVKKE